MTANHNIIKLLLPAALCLLLSVALLPDSYNSFTTKAVSLSDSSLSLPGIQRDAPGTTDGETQKFQVAATTSVVAPVSIRTIALPNSILGPSITFTVSQARAPPSF
ncbi:MAG: hypothetical protein R3E64_11155 [Halioglobus sp.]